MQRLLALLLLCLCALLSSPSAAPASEPAWRAWAAEARKQHPLAGKVYDARRGALADPASPGINGDNALLLPEGIVLLGEVHDNPAHHRLRAWLIAETARLRPDWRPAVVFEHITTAQQGALAHFGDLAERARRLPTADDLLRLLEWEKSGWPAAAMFQPLFSAVVASKLPILPGSPPREKVRKLAREGGTTLETAERTRLHLDDPLPGQLAEALERELGDSHCGALPPQAIPGMAVAQRYRDAHLADALLAAEERHGSAILIAGNGHVRADRGVPWHIRLRKPDARLLSVVLVETEPGRTDPAAYLPRDPRGQPAADLLIFTPRVERGDPCQSLFKGKR